MFLHLWGGQNYWQKPKVSGVSAFLSTLGGEWTAKELENLVAVRKDLSFETPWTLVLAVDCQLYLDHVSERRN